MEEKKVEKISHYCVLYCKFIIGTVDYEGNSVCMHLDVANEKERDFII